MELLEPKLDNYVSSPALFNGLPEIPSGLSEVMRYKFEMSQYKQRIKGTTWIFVQMLAALLVLGIIWITVLWVKVAVTFISILIIFILLVALTYTL